MLPKLIDLAGVLAIFALTYGVGLLLRRDQVESVASDAEEEAAAVANLQNGDEA